MDGTNYRPAAHVLDRLRQVHFVAVVAPTAVGKTTAMKTAIQRWPQLHMVLNNTSRQARPGEQYGKDYLFKTREEMEARIKKGEYVQVAPSLFGDWYATAPEDYATEGVAVLAVLAEAVPLFRALPFKSMRTIFMVPPSWDVWQQRLRTHNFTLDQLKGRVHEATASLQFALTDQQTQFLVNDSIDLAAEDFATLALGQPAPPRLQADQSRARQIAYSLFDRLQHGPSQPDGALSPAL